MADLILHHYPNSPFSEKVRVAFGIKQPAWKSVIIPNIMPKPDLMPLTGGYRKTPVLQVGADIYCDTQLIMLEVEKRRAARVGSAVAEWQRGIGWHGGVDPRDAGAAARGDLGVAPFDGQALLLGHRHHLAGAIAAMFMGQHAIGQGSRCYIAPPGAARAYLLLPMLTQLAEQAAGSTFVALAFLRLMEIEPLASRLTFMARAVAAWWRVQDADAEFWIGHAIGRRVCEWIDKAVYSAPVSPNVLESKELIEIVDILVKCGTPLARALEERLTALRKGEAGV